MIALILCSLYLIGLLVFFLKRDYVLFYYIGWSVFAPYVASFVTLDYDVSLFIDGQANYFLTVVFLLTAISRKSLKISSKSTSCITAIVLLLSIGAIINSVPFSFYLFWLVSNILPLYFVVYILQTLNVTFIQLCRYLGIMLIIQIIVGICQYYTGLLVNPAYALKNISFLYDTFFKGTFRGDNNCMAFVSICYLVMAYYYRISHTRGHSLYFLILTIITFFSVLISGIRTYLVLLIVFASLFVFFSSRKKSITLITLAGVLFVASTYLIVSDYSSGRSGDTNAIERQINGISAMVNNDTEGSTLDFTYYMLEKHYNPIHLFGEGKLHTKRGYDRITLSAGTEASVSDATLAVFLVEFGPILLFLFLYYYFHLTCGLFITKKSHIFKYSISIFIFFLIASVTDAGIFDANTLTILAMFTSLLKNESLQTFKRNKDSINSLQDHMNLDKEGCLPQ